MRSTSKILLANSVEARGKQDNVAFFAFTATPKHKTLSLFGERMTDAAGAERFEAVLVGGGKVAEGLRTVAGPTACAHVSQAWSATSPSTMHRAKCAQASS